MDFFIEIISNETVHFVTEVNCLLNNTCVWQRLFFSHKFVMIICQSKKEKVLVVECRGHDAARLQNVDHLHG